MNAELLEHPQLLSLLEAARQTPEDDSPRLVLADWLEDRGDSVRAEFIRLQCRLAPGSSALEDEERTQLEGRCKALLSRHGGGWLGPLWQYWLSPLSWHRGLLAVQLPRRFDAAGSMDILSWIDTALFRVTGPRSLKKALALLGRMGVNHVYLDLRQAIREETQLKELAQVAEAPCLRSLTIDWPFHLIRLSAVRHQRGGEAMPGVTDGFLRRLLVECPLTRHLTHFASAEPFNDRQAALIRELGVETAHAKQRLWMHEVVPSCFRERSARAPLDSQQST